jgi:protein TonB
MLIHKVEPEYSPQARMAKLCGDVVVSLVVDEEGNPRDLRVIQSLGMGLDQKALQAIRLWRFKPGRKDGKSVAVEATVRVEFRLL